MSRGVLHGGILTGGGFVQGDIVLIPITVRDNNNKKPPTLFDRFHSSAVCRTENMSRQCPSEWNGTQVAGQFHGWWSETDTIPMFLVPLLFPLLNFKSAAIFAKMNSLGEDYLLIY